MHSPRFHRELQNAPLAGSQDAIHLLPVHIPLFLASSFCSPIQGKTQADPAELFQARRWLNLQTLPLTTVPSQPFFHPDLCLQKAWSEEWRKRRSLPEDVVAAQCSGCCRCLTFPGNGGSAPLGSGTYFRNKMVKQAFLVQTKRLFTELAIAQKYKFTCY